MCAAWSLGGSLRGEEETDGSGLCSADGRREKDRMEVRRERLGEKEESLDGYLCVRTTTRVLLREKWVPSNLSQGC